MPTKRPRVSWIIDPVVIEELKWIAEDNRRSVATQAEIALEKFIDDYNAGKHDSLGLSD